MGRSSIRSILASLDHSLHQRVEPPRTRLLDRAIRLHHIHGAQRPYFGVVAVQTCYARRWRFEGDEFVVGVGAQTSERHGWAGLCGDRRGDDGHRPANPVVDRLALTMP